MLTALASGSFCAGIVHRFLETTTSKLLRWSHFFAALDQNVQKFQDVSRVVALYYHFDETVINYSTKAAAEQLASRKPMPQMRPEELEYLEV